MRGNTVYNKRYQFLLYAMSSKAFEIITYQTTNIVGQYICVHVFQRKQ